MDTEGCPPLPHQADCLAALRGNAFFSTIDSRFYNIPMCEEDKKYTAFMTPVGLYEYNTGCLKGSATVQLGLCELC